MINIEDSSIKKGVIEIIWYADIDKESGTSEFPIDKDMIFKAVEETSSDIQYYKEAHVAGVLFKEFDLYRTEEQLKFLLTKHLND